MKINPLNKNVFSNKIDDSFNIFYIFGNNLGLIDICYSKLKKNLEVDLDNPFITNYFDENKLLTNTEAFFDEFNSISLFGSKKTIIVDIRQGDKKNDVTKIFTELDKEELYQILRLRSEVFVVEQDCVYQDIDNKDQKAIHLFYKKEEEIIAYTRIFKKGDYYENPSIGRVVVSKNKRGKDLGKEIMLESMKYIKNNIKGEKIELSAQVYLDNFYKDLGFYSKGEEYLEDGIPHQRMFFNLV